MSSAERTRRHRRHKADDHSLCIPGNCPHVTPVVEPATPVAPAAEPEPAGLAEEKPIAPAGPKLGPSGARLWQQMAPDLAGGHLVLLLEACRIADRLDRLHDLIEDGADWLRLQLEDETSRVAVVVMNKPLGEARQQATALKQIIAELRMAKAVKVPAAKPKPKQTAPETVPAEPRGAGSVADLSARIAARRSPSTG